MPTRPIARNLAAAGCASSRRRGGHERELIAKPGAGGAPEVTFELDGERQPFDDSARAWLGRMLPELFRETGVDAKGRVGRILARGGVDAVLAEMRLIRSDYVQRVYSVELLQQAKPDAAQVERVVALAARSIESDYDLAELGRLRGSRGASRGPGREFGEACAPSTPTTTCFARCQVGRLPRTDGAERALGCARGISSDYDRSELPPSGGALAAKALGESFFTSPAA